MHETTLNRLTRALVKGVGAKFVVGLMLSEHVVDDHQEAASDSNHHALLVLVQQQATKLGSQVHVSGAPGGLGRLDQRRT